MPKRILRLQGTLYDLGWLTLCKSFGRRIELEYEHWERADIQHLDDINPCLSTVILPTPKNDTRECQK